MVYNSASHLSDVVPAVWKKCTLKTDNWVNKQTSTIELKLKSSVEVILYM